MRDLIFALGVLAVAEGFILALFPQLLDRALDWLRETPRERVRVAGLVAATVGIALLWLSRSWG